MHLQGDDLTIVLFWIGLAVTLVVAAMSQAGWKHWLVIWSLFGFAGVFLILGLAWPWVKSLSPPGVGLITEIATNSVSWFVVIMFTLALYLFVNPKPQATAASIAEEVWNAPVWIDRSPPLIEFSEAIPGCRVPSSLSDGEQAIFFRAKVTNPSNQPEGCHAYLVGVHKQDMAGKFVPTKYAEHLLLTWSVEGAMGPSTYQTITKAIPRFLDILYVGDKHGVVIATDRFSWPHSVSGLFDEAGVYLLEIIIQPAVFLGPRSAKFILQWPGDWQRATLSLTL